jgi:hypothetical protein
MRGGSIHLNILSEALDYEEYMHGNCGNAEWPDPQPQSKTAGGMVSNTLVASHIDAPRSSTIMWECSEGPRQKYIRTTCLPINVDQISLHPLSSDTPNMPPGERPPQFRPPIEKTTTYEARIKETDTKAPGTKDPGHKDEGEAVFILAVVVAVGYGVYYTGKGAYYGGYYTCKGIGNAYSFIGRQFSKEPREKEPQVKATKMKEPRVKTPDVEQAQVKQPQVKEPQMYVPRTRGAQVHSSREKTKARKREWRDDGSSFVVPLLRKNSEEEEDEKEALILAEKRNKKFEREMALVCGAYVSGVGTMIPAYWRLRVVQSTDTHKTQNAQYM